MQTSSRTQPARRISSVLSREELTVYNTRRDAPGMQYLAMHLALTATTGVLVWLAAGGPWLIPMMFVHGIVLVYWFQALHECTHKSAFKTGLLNRAVAHLSGFIIFVPPAYFAFEHTAHHAYTQDVGRDPERIPQGDSFKGYLWYASGLPYFKGLLGPLFRVGLGRFNLGEAFIPARARATVTREARFYLGFYTAVAAVSLLMQSGVVLVYWVIPRLIGEPVMRLVRMTEHVGCPNVPDFFRNTRTVLTNPLLKIMGWNGCYHAEHHLSPGTPFFALPQLHQLLKNDIENVSPSYWHANQEVVRHSMASNTPDQ